MTGGERLKQALHSIRKHTTRRPRQAERPDLLTYDWARDIDARVAAHERQLKILNATILTALIADIVTRLLKP
jgi:hypothetical protein